MFDQLHGDRVAEWKTDGALAYLARRELVLERLDRMLACRIQRVVLLPASKVQHDSTVQSVGMNLAGDHSEVIRLACDPLARVETSAQAWAIRFRNRHRL